MSVLILCLLVDLQQKVGNIITSKVSCLSIIVLENALNQCIEKMLLW
jgi:hypothetical protein